MKRKRECAGFITFMLLMSILPSSLAARLTTPVRCAAQVAAGSYQTTAGVVTITVDGAQFMGVNSAESLLFGYRSYDFIATADHQLTFHISAPSNPFPADASNVYSEMKVKIDGVGNIDVNGTDTQLLVDKTIDLALPPNAIPLQSAEVVYYGSQSYNSSKDLRSLYPDYYFGSDFFIRVFEIPTITLKSNVTSITLPYDPSAGLSGNTFAGVLLTGSVLPPESLPIWQVSVNGQQYTTQDISADSNGAFNFTETFDAMDQLMYYGNDSATFTYVANYTSMGTGSAFVTSDMLASAATVNVTVTVSQEGQLPPPSENSTTRLPVIFLPGVGGTELDVQSGGEPYPTWPIPGGPSRWQAARHFWQLATKSDMSTLNLTSNGTAPADPNVSVIPGDILRTAPADYYGGMIVFLTSIGYVEGQNLFVFPYDWRLDNMAHLQDLDVLVDHALAVNGSQKVVLLAHSMGGLIAAAYVNSDPAKAAKVDSIITMGTPFWGSPKCYYALTEGYGLGNYFADVQQMKSMMCNWPAVYELLPKSSFISMHADYLSLADSFNITYRDAYTNAPAKFNAQMLDVANAFNSLLGTPNHPVLASGVKLYTIIGFGTQTLEGYYARSPTGYEYLHNNTVTFNGEDVALVPKFGDGDGTVPLWGAENDAATAKYYIRTCYSTLFGETASHAYLAVNQKVQAIVASILNGTPADPNDQLYVDMRLNQLETEDFTIHSDANLEILDGNGGMMGWNGYNGTICEDLPQGTFLCQDGIQYASIQNASNSYTVFVNGTQTGEFTMTVNITKDGATTVFAYQNVTVANGTIAQLSLSPGMADNTLPALSVTTGENTTLVFATLISRSGGQPPWLSTILFAALVAVPLTAVLVTLSARHRRKRQWVPPPPPGFE